MMTRRRKQIMTEGTPVMNWTRQMTAMPRQTAPIHRQPLMEPVKINLNTNRINKMNQPQQEVAHRNSTNKGIMTHQEASVKSLGGRALSVIY